MRNKKVNKSKNVLTELKWTELIWNYDIKLLHFDILRLKAQD